MKLLRAFFLRHRAGAMVVVIAALCMKMLVPGGFMVGSANKVLTVEICADASGQKVTRHIPIAMNGKTGGEHRNEGKAGTPCPWSALSTASLAGADPALLALALTFILALGLAPARLTLLRPAFHLRPPLRGPPALA